MGSKEWYHRNKERSAAKRKAYRESHKMELAVKKKAYADMHKEESRAYHREYYQAHKERAKAYNQAHKERRAEIQRGYYKAYKERYEAFPETHKDIIRLTKHARWRKHAYKLSSIEYHILLELQFYQCAICQEWLDLSKRTHVDHDHQTGEVRGILCSHCNHMLGHAREDINTLQSAVHYLEKGGVFANQIKALEARKSAQAS